MAKPDRSRTGLLGLQLTLAFIGVGLAAVVAALLIFAMTVDGNLDQLVHAEQTELTTSVARAASLAYGHAGWARADLSPIMALASHTGDGIQIRSSSGRVIRSTPGFVVIATRGPVYTKPITVRGRPLGSARIAFGHGYIARLIDHFIGQRWSARAASAILAILIAAVVAIPLSRLITAPVDRLIWAVRAAAGEGTRARVGDVKGFGRLQELSAAFDRMADAMEEQDQLRRNLVADVAHEVRTPIAVLQAGHEAMLEGVIEPTREHLASLHDEVLRLARMVDDLQRLASAEAAAVQLTPVRRDLAAVAATAAASLVDSFESADVTLVERLAKVDVMCDPLRMHEVIVNLLTNALKFTQAGGQVTLETERSDEIGKLRVTDTGVGIPAEELPRVSERFFRGRRSAEVAGSGIGLTIVAELVRAHHGNLSIASQEGQGTTVSVILPLARPSQAAKPRSGGRRKHAGIITGSGSGDEPSGSGDKPCLVENALECPDMPPRYPDTSNALDVVAHRDGGDTSGLPAHPVPLDRPNVRFTTLDITQRLWHDGELPVEIAWR